MNSLIITSLWFKTVLLTLLINKEKRRERFARKQIGGDQSEANGGTDFFLEDNLKNCPVKAERPKC